MKGESASSVSGMPPSTFDLWSIFLINRRWAVKESIYKAVYPTLKPTWKDFTLRKCARSPKPDLVYHPRDDLLSSRLGQIHTSASHDRDYVFATVVVEQPTQV